MNIFKRFRKKSPEDIFREKIRKGFDNSVNNVMPKLVGDPLFDGTLVQAAIASFYQAAKNDAAPLRILLEIDTYSIIKEECKYALNKYLE